MIQIENVMLFFENLECANKIIIYEKTLKGILIHHSKYHYQDSMSLEKNAVEQMRGSNNPGNH